MLRIVWKWKYQVAARILFTPYSQSSVIGLELVLVRFEAKRLQLAWKFSNTLNFIPIHHCHSFVIFK